MVEIEVELRPIKRKRRKKGWNPSGRISIGLPLWIPE